MIHVWMEREPENYVWYTDALFESLLIKREIVN